MITYPILMHTYSKTSDNGQTACPLPLTVHTFLPPTKGQPPNNGQNARPQRVHYSEVPLYNIFECIMDNAYSLTRPATVAVVVAIAGTIRPANNFVLNLSTLSIEYIDARRFWRGRGWKMGGCEGGKEGREKGGREEAREKVSKYIQKHCEFFNVLKWLVYILLIFIHSDP